MAHIKQHKTNNKRKFIDVEAKEAETSNSPILSEEEEEDYEEEEQEEDDEEEEENDSETTEEKTLRKEKSKREASLRPDEKRGLMDLREERDGYREEIADLYTDHKCISDMIYCAQLLNRHIHKQIKHKKRFGYRHSKGVITKLYLKMSKEEQRYYQYNVDILGDNESQCSLGIRAILGYEDNDWNLNKYLDSETDCNSPHILHNDTSDK